MVAVSEPSRAKREQHRHKGSPLRHLDLLRVSMRATRPPGTALEVSDLVRIVGESQQAVLPVGVGRRWQALAPFLSCLLACCARAQGQTACRSSLCRNRDRALISTLPAEWTRCSSELQRASWPRTPGPPPSWMHLRWRSRMIAAAKTPGPSRPCRPARATRRAWTCSGQPSFYLVEYILRCFLGQLTIQQC